jgi:ketosteroid isomerase-like protein
MRWILFIGIFLFRSNSLFSQSNSDSLDVVALIKSDYVALGNADIEARKKNCAQDYILIENGEIWNLEKELGYMKSKMSEKTVRQDHFDFKTVKIIGDVAYLVYELRSEITRDGAVKNIQWTESAIVSKYSGAWRIKLIHSTKIRE